MPIVLRERAIIKLMGNNYEFLIEKKIKEENSFSLNLKWGEKVFLHSTGKTLEKRASNANKWVTLKYDGMG